MSATAPLDAAIFDRSVWSGAAGYRFLVPYLDGHVLDTSPAAANSDSIVLW